MLPTPAWSGAHQHDGFFLRISTGIGWASTDAADSPRWLVPPGSTGDNGEFSGFMGDMNVSIGGVVGHNLAIHATAWVWIMPDPDFDPAFEPNSIPLDEVNGYLSMSAIGVGATCYFRPSNLFLSWSLGVGQMELDHTGMGNIETDWGGVLDAAFGKEWWISGNWALGLAGSVGLHSFQEMFEDDYWSGINLGLRFSATFD